MPPRASGLKLPSDLARSFDLIGAYGSDQVVAALQRGLMFRRFTAVDIRSILDAGTGVAEVVDECPPVDHGLPAAPARDLSAYALKGWS